MQYKILASDLAEVRLAYILLVLWVRLFMVCTADQVIYIYAVIICQFAGIFQGQRTLAPFIFGIKGLVAH